MMKFEQKNKNSIKLLFNQIAQNYDKLNNLISFGFHKKIKKAVVKKSVQKLGFSPLKVLDLCCGTGDIAKECKKSFPDAEVVAIDFSQEMLDIAMKNSQGIIYLNADITNLEEIAFLEKESFDAIFISFGLRNLPDIDSFLENIKEYLSSNGVLAILDLGKPHLLTKPYFFLHYNLIIPLFAKLFAKDIAPYKYLVRSAKKYPSQKEIIAKMEQFGYKNCQIVNYFCGIISQQMGQKI